MPRFSVVIPVLNGGVRLHTVVHALRAQVPAPDSIILIDSGTSDSSLDGISEGAVRVEPISGKFNHGSARNQALSVTSSPFLVFMTQDAVPHPEAMQKLLQPLLLEGACASYARQVAQPNASPLERFARGFNYPRSGAKLEKPQEKVRKVFFSNACSAVRRDIFQAVGGFPTHTIMNEDMVFAARVQALGHQVAYVADAVVEHSHDYTLVQTFKRYFDIGVVLEQAKNELGDAGATREGKRFVRGLFTWLWANGYYAWLPRAFAESAAKWVGTSLGRKHKMLPLSVVRHLSMHRDYWSDRS